MTLTFGSLFAGIGGIDLGLERAGMRCAFQVEIDDYATRVLAKHWPDVPRYRDVRECGAHNLPAVDVLAGGFPCQDISSAGKRAGIDGTRSGLWAEFARIIRELRPRYALLENVSALLHRGLDRVLGDLAALGYDAEWHCIPAAAFGAPHRRDRIFIVAYPNGERQQQPSGAIGQERRRVGDGGQTLANAERDRWQQSAEVLRTGQPLIAAGGQDIPIPDCQRLDGRRVVFPATFAPGIAGPEGDHPWRTEPDVGRVAHGISARVDRLRGLGNAVVPQIAEHVGHLIDAHHQCNTGAAR